MHWHRRTNSPIGIDTNGRFINAAQLGRAGGGWRVESAVSIPRTGSETVPEETEAETVARVLGRQGFAGRRVVLAMPDADLMTDVVSATGTSPPTADHVRRAVAQSHRCDAAAVECAYWELPRRQRPGGSAAVMAVACERTKAARLLDAFERAGLAVVGLDVRAWALARACAAGFESASGHRAILDLGWNAAAMIVLSGEVVVYERAVPELGLATLHASICERVGLEPEIAQHLLEETGLNDDCGDGRTDAGLVREVQGHVASYIEGLIPTVQSSFAYATQEYGGQPIDELVTVGDGAAIPGLAARLSSSLDAPVRVATPAALGGCDEHWATPRFMTAVGLAMFEEDKD